MNYQHTSEDNTVKKGYGKGVYAGVAYGKLFYIESISEAITPGSLKSINDRISDYEEAKKKTLGQLNDILEKIDFNQSAEERAIIEGHMMILNDVLFFNAVREKIMIQNMDTVSAVKITGKEFSDNLHNLDDKYMRERADDIEDITERLIDNLLNRVQIIPEFKKPMVIVADNLNPSIMMQLDKEKILGIMMKRGSVTSHAAIIARSLCIPTVVGCNLEVSKKDDGNDIIVNGIDSECILEPSEADIREAVIIKEKYKQKKDLLIELKGKENITLDGHKIDVFANIESNEDIEDALLNDAGGIGLFRSEFLFLGRNDFPTEEEQFLAYKSVAEKMKGKKVIIRTLDIGADKKAGYFDIGEEDNPAMGMRAIRICLTRPEIFKMQLRAIYRASTYGNVAIMFPMIISEKEVLKIKKIANEVRDSLKEEAIPYNEVEMGIMIETPAAVMIADILADMVDFFSVGTNDLTQYTLAIDRQNEALTNFYDAHHPAILKMLRMIADSAKKKGIWAGICGELAADKSLTKEIIKMGYSELSVSSGSILELRSEIRGLTIEE